MILGLRYIAGAIRNALLPLCRCNLQALRRRCLPDKTYGVNTDSAWVRDRPLYRAR
jgi:hypothetical protein